MKPNGIVYTIGNLPTPDKVITLDKEEWYVYEDKENMIVIPKDDTKPHGGYAGENERILWSICRCRPYIEPYDGNGRSYKKTVIIHHSFKQAESLRDFAGFF